MSTKLEHQANIPQPNQLNELLQASYLYELTDYVQFHMKTMIRHK